MTQVKKFDSRCNLISVIKAEYKHVFVTKVLNTANLKTHKTVNVVISYTDMQNVRFLARVTEQFKLYRL